MSYFIQSIKKQPNKIITYKNVRQVLHVAGFPRACIHVCHMNVFINIAATSTLSSAALALCPCC